MIGGIVDLPPPEMKCTVPSGNTLKASTERFEKKDKKGYQD